MKQERTMNVNRNYKDSVFTFLFNDPTVLRELYGAIAGVELAPDVPVTINTLEGVLYQNLLNDISFLLGDKQVILVEHQSTINPNLPLRILMYISRIYEKMMVGRNVYGRKKLKVPVPEFIVLYNGKEKYPDQEVIRLTDLYEGGVLGEKRSGGLEVEVRVYNINKGHNEGIVRRCERLRGYSIFIGKEREFEAGGLGREDAIGKAVKWCIGEGVLGGFLEEHGSEVMNMLMAEWKLEDALVVEREEGREEGLEQGREEGLGLAARNLFTRGMKADWIAGTLNLPLDRVQQYLEQGV
jgi:hypothetical protein